MNKDKYKISDLANILGISETAIRRKIKEDTNNPNTKRYKNRFDVINEYDNGKNVTFILLDKAELETEKNIAKTNKETYSVKDNLNQTFTKDTENVKNADMQENFNETRENEKEMFTERYIEHINNLNETYMERLEKYADELIKYKSKIPLLEDKADREGFYLNEIEELKKNVSGLESKNKKLLIGLIVSLITFVIVLITIIIMLSINNSHTNNNAEIEKQLPVAESVATVKTTKGNLKTK